MTLIHTATRQSLLIVFMIMAFASGMGLANSKSAAAQDRVPVGCTREWYDGYLVAAHTLGLEDFELHAALHDGKSIAEVAGEMGVDPQLVIDALVAIESALVRKMERGQCLTTDEAEAWIAGLPAKMRHFIGVDEAVDPAAQPKGTVIFVPILMN